jgi:crossover junction endodeoxyribonuclease RusA
MEQDLTISVEGDPASQGSHAIMRGRIVQVNNAKLTKWRKAIMYAVQDVLPEDWQPIDEACELNVTFFMPRGSTVTRRMPSVAPDLDKLIRAVGDALTQANAITDDSRIVRISARKVYAQGVPSGASINIKPIKL